MQTYETSDIGTFLGKPYKWQTFDKPPNVLNYDPRVKLHHYNFSPQRPQSYAEIIVDAFS